MLLCPTQAIACHDYRLASPSFCYKELGGHTSHIGSRSPHTGSLIAATCKLYLLRSSCVVDSLFIPFLYCPSKGCRRSARHSTQFSVPYESPIPRSHLLALNHIRHATLHQSLKLKHFMPFTQVAYLHSPRSLTSYTLQVPLSSLNGASSTCGMSESTVLPGMAR